MKFLMLLFHRFWLYFADRDRSITGAQDASEATPADSVRVHPVGQAPVPELAFEYQGQLVPESTDPPKPLPHYLGRYTWCINRAHGALQAGKRSPVRSETGRRFLEWEWADKIVDLIIEQLEEIGVSYFEVVPEANVGQFLRGRVDRANNHVAPLPKVYLSVHANAGPAPDLDTWSSAAGTETWCYHQSAKGRKMADIFQRKLVAATGFKDRGVRSRPEGQFYELRATHMPSVLTEAGFYNNVTECRQLTDPAVMQRIADAHVEAILEIEELGL